MTARVRQLPVKRPQGDQPRRPSTLSAALPVDEIGDMIARDARAMPAGEPTHLDSEVVIDRHTLLQEVLRLRALAPGPDDLMSGPQLARLFGVNVRTTNRWREAGHVRAVTRRPGGHYLYLTADVLALHRTWLQADHHWPTRRAVVGRPTCNAMPVDLSPAATGMGPCVLDPSHNYAWHVGGDGSRWGLRVSAHQGVAGGTR